jgi:membrane protease subunit HflK
MAWNEDGNGKDPWKRDGNEPVELDQIVREWQKRFGSILGGRGGSSSGGGGGAGSIALVVLLFIAWLLTGLYRVDAAEQGVVQRFGAYTITTGPGLRWHLPFPIETVDVVNIEEVNKFNYSTEMLTADKWYVFIDIVVQYRRTDPVLYSFEVQDPDQTLEDVAESALRGVAGTSTLASLIGARRDEISARTLEELQQTLTDYGAGLTVTSVNLNVVNYPRVVEDAVADTVRADNDSERYRFEAEAYQNNLVGRAEGEKQRLLQDAEAYRERVVADATGEASRFEALLTEYKKAPRVTRDRLYIEAIEDIYSRSSKVLIDADGSGNLMYLPLDQLLKRSGIDLPGASGTGPSDGSNTTSRPPESTRTDSGRERGDRS